MHCIKKESNELHRDCLPILMLLYIMLYILLAHLMLFATLFNGVIFVSAIPSKSS